MEAQIRPAVKQMSHHPDLRMLIKERRNKEIFQDLQIKVIENANCIHSPK